MNEAMTITITVPMTTPSTVRNERNLCDLKVSNAIRTLSVTSCLFIPSHSRPPVNQSTLNASMGSSFAAFQAGYIPKKSPMRPTRSGP